VKPAFKEALRSVFAALARRSPADYTKELGLKLYARKAARSPEYRSWVEVVGDERFARHYGHTRVDDPFTLEHLKWQLFEVTRALRRRVGLAPSMGRVLDAGASDGLFLEALGARWGLGYNLLEACVVQIQKDGWLACRGDIEALPFRDQSFDAVVCCETLEHVPNPVRALCEFARVCRGRLYLTIPGVAATRVCPRSDTSPSVDTGHVFELSPRDFATMLSHTPWRLVHSEVVRIFPRVSNPVHSLVLGQVLFPRYFPVLQLHELTRAD